MIDESHLKPIPCLLVMDKDKTFRLYDVRADHPESLIMSFKIDKPEKSGWGMTFFYNHLRTTWIDKLYKRLKKACKAAKQKDGKHIVKRPAKFSKKWKETRKRRTLFSSDNS